MIISFEDLLLTSYQRKLLCSFIKERKVPHLIFYGPSGTGKTTTAYSISKEVLVDLDFSFLELNASNDRGVDTIRNIVTNFAKNKSLCDEKKILLMDESESLTTQAQACLRRIMEIYEDNFTIIFTTNNLRKIDQAVKSRAVLISFDKLKEPVIRNFLIKKGFNNSDMKNILKGFSGDIRHVIKYLKFPDYESYKELSLDVFFKEVDITTDTQFMEKLETHYNFNYHKFFDDLIEVIISKNLCKDILIKIITELAFFDENISNNGSFKLNALNFKIKVNKILN